MGVPNNPPAGFVSVRHIYLTAGHTHTSLASAYASGILIVGSTIGVDIHSFIHSYQTQVQSNPKNKHSPTHRITLLRSSAWQYPPQPFLVVPIPPAKDCLCQQFDLFVVNPHSCLQTLITTLLVCLQRQSPTFSWQRGRRQKGQRSLHRKNRQPPHPRCRLLFHKSMQPPRPPHSARTLTLVSGATSSALFGDVHSA
jgi:hypothetical protein